MSPVMVVLKRMVGCMVMVRCLPFWVYRSFAGLLGRNVQSVYSYSDSRTVGVRESIWRDLILPVSCDHDGSLEENLRDAGLFLES